MRRSGFTLIELLVVIAVIAVLMAILMPALNLARDQGRRIQCASNVRSLTIAWVVYQDENDGQLVSGNVPRGAGFSNTGVRYWVEPPQNVQGNYTGDSAPSLEDELRGIERGALFPYVKEVQAYRCPSDERRRIEDAAFRSYSIAAGMNGEERTNYTERGLRKYIQIKTPAAKYVFVEESDGRGWNIGSWVINVTGDQWGDPLSIWHNKRSTLGWADGHASVHRWVDPRTIEMSEEGRGWVIQPDNEDLKFMQRGYALRPGGTP